MTIKISLLKKGDWFEHKNCTYEIIEFDYVFTTAKKLVNDDGTKHYFLNSIIVEKKVKDFYQRVNPNWQINDLRKQNND